MIPRQKMPINRAGNLLKLRLEKAQSPPPVGVAETLETKPGIASGSIQEKVRVTFAVSGPTDLKHGQDRKVKTGMSISTHGFD